MARNTTRRESPQGRAAQNEALETALLQRLAQATTPGPAQPQAPPTYGASRVSVTMSAPEIALTFGVMRVLIDPTTGQPGPNVALEWLATYSLSPIVALQLRDIMADIIDRYEKTFGPIPKDPNFRISVQEQEVKQPS
jgi:hypothetical protein